MFKLGKISKKSILVIGDVMLDKYYVGEVKRISPEAPVPVFRKKTERSVLGGAANVAANLVAANQKVAMMSIIGHDEAGKQLQEYFKQKGICVDLMWETERNTTIKTRFLAENNQQLLRLDVEDTEPISENICLKMLKKLEEEIDCYHLILLSDYLKGLLTYNFTQGVIRLAKEHGIPVIIDVKDPQVEKYKGACLLKPNLKEIRELTGMPAQTDQEIIEAAETLRERCDCEYVLCTCGARGMVLVGKNHDPFFIGSQVREVYDVSGAGDTTISYLAAGMANGVDMDDAVTIANIAAGIQVGKTGTSSVYMREVRDFLANEDEGTFHKILNSDDSVKRLKGPERPINSEQDRTEMLCAMKFVDYVVVFAEDTPYELIRKIQPDILVKGGDYKPEEVVGRDIVEARGGRLELIKFVDGKSTTNIINKINHK